MKMQNSRKRGVGKGKQECNTEVRSSKIRAKKYPLDLVIRKPYGPTGAVRKANRTTKGCK